MAGGGGGGGCSLLCLMYLGLSEDRFRWVGFWCLLGPLRGLGSALEGGSIFLLGCRGGRVQWGGGAAPAQLTHGKGLWGSRPLRGPNPFRSPPTDICIPNL